MRQKNRYLAIDGGGTKTAFLLADETGNPIETVRLGPSNPNDVGIDAAKKTLRQGIKAICGTTYSDVVLYAGIAGARTGNNKLQLLDFFQEFGFRQYDCGSDIDSLMAMGDHKEQIFVILGTGIIAFAKKNNEIFRVAGWGQLFDCAGSGYDIGRDGICAALRASDGTGNPTRLNELLEREIGESPAEHLPRFYSGGKRYIAGFARLVFEAREKGDDVAQKILDRNISHIVRIIQAAAAQLPGNRKEVLLTGGLIDAQQSLLLPMLEQALGPNYHLVCNRQPPVYGALRMAMKEK